MKVGSFDIGMKNLGVCVLEPDAEQAFRILAWDLISLVSQQGKKSLVCDQKLIRKGVKCGKKASQWSPETRKGYCRTHSGKVVKETGVGLERYTTTKNITDLELNQQIIRRLEQMPILWTECQEVVIESQKRADMKKVLYMIFGFLTQKMVQLGEENCSLRNIKVISAGHKLAMPVERLGVVLPEVTSRGLDGGTYKGRKLLGKEHCEILLERDQERLEFFRSHKKQDDLADAFLQGLWYMLDLTK